MFEMLFDAFSAWNALLYIFAGGVVSGLGLIIAGYTAWVRARERSYAGEIVGVRTETPGAKMYWPVVAYRDENGTRHEVLANSSASFIGSAAPGAKVTLYADPRRPAQVLIARDWWLLLALGLFLFACGSPFLIVGLSILHLTKGAALVAAACAVWGGIKLFRFAHPFLDARKAGGFAAAREAFIARRAARKDLAAMAALSSTNIAAVRERERRQSQWTLPVLTLGGLALLVGGGFWFEHQRAFLATALSAEGTVLRNEESNSADSEPSYHPVIAFSDRDGDTVTYEDGVGTSPPLYSTGDKVTILYAPENSAHAQIDRGIWNWLVPLLLAAVGALLAGATLRAILKRRDAPAAAAATLARQN